MGPHIGRYANSSQRAPEQLAEDRCEGRAQPAAWPKADHDRQRPDRARQRALPV